MTDAEESKSGVIGGGGCMSAHKVKIREVSVFTLFALFTLGQGFSRRLLAMIVVFLLITNNCKAGGCNSDTIIEEVEKLYQFPSDITDKIKSSPRARDYFQKDMPSLKKIYSDNKGTYLLVGCDEVATDLSNYSRQEMEQMLSEAGDKMREKNSEISCEYDYSISNDLPITFYSETSSVGGAVLSESYQFGMRVYFDRRRLLVIKLLYTTSEEDNANDKLYKDKAEDLRKIIYAKYPKPNYKN